MTAATIVDVNKLNTLIEINGRINSSYSDINTLLTYILESAMYLVACESASLLLVNKDSNTLRFEVALGPKGREAREFSVNIEGSLAGWVVRHNESLVINDVVDDPRHSNIVPKGTGYITYNMISIPLRMNTECVGVVQLLNKAHGEPFNKEDLKLLELMVNQASIAYQNAVSYERSRNEIGLLQNQLAAGQEYHAFVAESSVILDLMVIVERVAETNSSVLILGESGVGKELFAEQIHLKSARAGKPFVRVNCAALTPSLLESELFGHVKGAYTDAVTTTKGRFETANGGTIFLDEIGDMPLDLQAKLLRAIQSRSFEKVGSSETISVDVRILAATNRDIEKLVEEGKFRGDLYYRLNVVPLFIPPLRKRTDDIPSLADFFCRKFSKETKKNFLGISEQAMGALLSYAWPGNIRELEN
ncbi:MAG: sigma 54-interacting transcriptional regulator, partial [Spirochaetaceae bacterium]|nr:sigma 54-interacting transcriptional regulator [Spirochaetaceae bacterium]